ncbi:hypothetical protein B0H10DRAFT_1943217 [Mycena sp. CBHHK59/15]|nr:hypothetical protein B0H10DRAFT_1943217 [Mycena sp. CBHHK59/15]
MTLLEPFDPVSQRINSYRGFNPCGLRPVGQPAGTHGQSGTGLYPYPLGYGFSGTMATERTYKRTRDWGRAEADNSQIRETYTEINELTVCGSWRLRGTASSDTAQIEHKRGHKRPEDATQRRGKQEESVLQSQVDTGLRQLETDTCRGRDAQGERLKLEAQRWQQEKAGRGDNKAGRVMWVVPPWREEREQPTISHQITPSVATHQSEFE